MNDDSRWGMPYERDSSPPCRHEWYRQCVLHRKGLSGTEVTTTFLPDQEGLKKGAKVRLKDREEENWSEGWEIESVGEKISGPSVEKGASEYKFNRKVKTRGL